MKIQVAKRDLEAALQVVSPSLGSGLSSNVSTHYVFRARKVDGKWKSEILTYTDRLCASCPFVSVLEVDDERKSSFTIEGARLKDLLKHVPDSVLELDFDGSDTTYSGQDNGSKSLKFRSLDPEEYPYWDDSLASAELTATLPAATLAKAFSLARPFVLLDAETRRPDLCVFEARDGVIHASNMKSASLVTVDGMEKSSIRIHGGDATKILSYLNSFGDGDDVEILESDLALYLRRSDGAVFGETKYNVRFPDNMKVTHIDEDPCMWKINVGDLKTAIGILHAVSDRNDTRLRFKSGVGDTIHVEMALASGQGDASQTVALVEAAEAKEDFHISPDGFLLDRDELKRVLSVYEEDILDMGIHPRGKSGFARFQVGGEGVQCQIILAWLRE